MIIIAGDSWSCGEWDGQGNISHPGLSQYIYDSGQTVVNLSIPACSNRESYLALRQFLLTNTYQRIDKIFVFQTEWARDFKYIVDDDYEYFGSVYKLQSRLISQCYYELTALAQEFNKEFYLIGGCSDTLKLYNFTQHYPRLHIACASMTELLTAKTTEPTFTLWASYSEDVMQVLKDHAESSDELTNLLTNFELGTQRLQLWKDHPEYFWPDGSHPNRIGHKILHEYLVKQGYI